ncbi:hypothetical protein FJZ53_04020 [Candidatus Woesearchaeota archaeon]|nr:hypothetical protein [Candidatus Woesearchaeota archaeon]
MTEGQYLVLWKVREQVPKRRFWDFVTKKKKPRREPEADEYEPVFEHSCLNGCTRPLLLKVTKE